MRPKRPNATSRPKTLAPASIAATNGSSTLIPTSSRPIPTAAICTRLTTTYGYDAEGSYSPDGKQIVFCSTRDGNPELYLMDADGSNVRRLTNAPRYDGGPFFSPDGRWIVFRSDRGKEGFLQIYVIGVDGKNETPLTDNPNTVNWAPYWHPTEPYIIWTGADHSDPKARPNYDLWLMRMTRRWPNQSPRARSLGSPTTRQPTCCRSFRTTAAG